LCRIMKLFGLATIAFWWLCLEGVALLVAVGWIMGLEPASGSSLFCFA